MKRAALILLLGLAILGACKKRESIPPDVVARVGERMITLEDFKRYLDRNAGTDLAQIAPEASSAVLDQFLEEILLSEYAASHGIEIPADQIAAAVRNDPGSRVEEKRDQMRRERLIADLTARVPPPPQTEVEQYYQQHPDEFQSADRVRVRQILVHDDELANQILNELRGGSSFEELSTRYSSAANAKSGGDIGYVARGELPPSFEGEIFSLKPGSVSKVIRTDANFHIFKVESFQPAGSITLATAEPLIRTRLTEESLRHELAQIISTARKEIPSAVLIKRLPFTYSGTLPTAPND
jgi:parvulin-like peptidyl-prolyl isomerase